MDADTIRRMIEDGLPGARAQVQAVVAAVETLAAAHPEAAAYAPGEIL